MTARFAGLPLSLVVASLGVGQPSQGPDIATAGAVKAVAGYVSEYQRQLTSVIAFMSTERSFNSGFDYESILCEARYANFRRFTTSVRIK